MDLTLYKFKFKLYSAFDVSFGFSVYEFFDDNFVFFFCLSNTPELEIIEVELRWLDASSIMRAS